MAKVMNVLLFLKISKITGIISLLRSRYLAICDCCLSDVIYFISFIYFARHEQHYKVLHKRRKEE